MLSEMNYDPRMESEKADDTQCELWAGPEVGEVWGGEERALEAGGLRALREEETQLRGRGA